MITLDATVILIYASTAIGLIWALINFFQVTSINLFEGSNAEVNTLLGDADRLKLESMLAIGEYISRGANAFLYQQYKILFFFCLVFAVIIKVIPYLLKS